MKVKWIPVCFSLFYGLIAVFDCAGFSKHPKTSIAEVAWLVLLWWSIAGSDWPFIIRRKLEHPCGEVYTKPILAWRVWYGSTMGDYLYGLYFNAYPWKPKQKMYSDCIWCCRIYNRPQPNTACSCGIYAKRSISLGFHSGSGTFSMKTKFKVLGLVHLWGNIIEGDSGYRAEFAYPAKLFILRKKYAADTYRLAEAFGIPCEKLSWFKILLFSIGGSRWISGKQKESIESSLLSSLFPQNQSENQVA